MKKYILIFLLFSVSAIAFLSYPFYRVENIVSIGKEHFVSIDKKKFILNGKEFYPIAINYIVSIQADKNELWPCPYIGYNKDNKYQYITKDSSLLQLKSTMDLIKEMGFNSIRVVGIGAPAIDDKITGLLSIKAGIGNQHDTTMLLSTEENYNKYFNALEELFGVANKAGLKIILLVPVFPDIKTTEDHLKKLLSRFKNDTSIMAYDLFNEPLYFDAPGRTKEDVYQIGKRWRKIARKSAPNHLITIGLEGIREVFEWDPNILDVDFISLHPYEYEPDQVRNEIYWYAKYIKKPWIIGETAIPADNDSITYEEQKIFAHNTLKQAYDCGAIGYSWWQYKDVEWHTYHASFLGVLNWHGETKTVKENIIVEGTVKPVAEEFKKFNPTAKKESCLCPENYYNYSRHKTFRITGHLSDDDNVPLQGGVILAWNQYWSASFHTITKADGSFELLGSFPFYHWMASASLYSMVRADISPDSAKTGSDGIPTIDIGTLKLKRLSFVKSDDGD